MHDVIRISRNRIQFFFHFLLITTGIGRRNVNKCLQMKTHDFKVITYRHVKFNLNQHHSVHSPSFHSGYCSMANDEITILLQLFAIMYQVKIQFRGFIPTPFREPQFYQNVTYFLSTFRTREFQFDLSSGEVRQLSLWTWVNEQKNLSSQKVDRWIMLHLNYIYRRILLIRMKHSCIPVGMELITANFTASFWITRFIHDGFHFCPSKLFWLETELNWFMTLIFCRKKKNLGKGTTLI